MVHVSTSLRSPTLRRRTHVMLVLTAATALLLAGCGGSDDTSNDNTSAGGNVVVTVDPNEANNVVVPERRCRLPTRAPSRHANRGFECWSSMRDFRARGPRFR